MIKLQKADKSAIAANIIQISFMLNQSSVKYGWYVNQYTFVKPHRDTKMTIIVIRYLDNFIVFNDAVICNQLLFFFESCCCGWDKNKLIKRPIHTLIEVRITGYKGSIVNKNHAHIAAKNLAKNL